MTRNELMRELFLSRNLLSKKKVSIYTQFGIKIPISPSKIANDDVIMEKVWQNPLLDAEA